MDRAPDGQYHPIFLKRFDPPNMVRFVSGLKSIQSEVQNFELGPGIREIRPFSGYISTHHFQLVTAAKIMKLTKISRRKGQSDFQENGLM